MILNSVVFFSNKIPVGVGVVGLFVGVVDVCAIVVGASVVGAKVVGANVAGAVVLGELVVVADVAGACVVTIREQSTLLGQSQLLVLTLKYNPG